MVVWLGLAIPRNILPARLSATSLSHSRHNLRDKISLSLLGSPLPNLPKAYPMAFRFRFSDASWFGVLFFFISLLLSIDSTGAAAQKYVQATTESGESLVLLDARKPALYTQNFGDCLGSSLINVTRFDAAYYKDNMTVLFHLEGNTAVANESLMRTWLSILR